MVNQFDVICSRCGAKVASGEGHIVDVQIGCGIMRPGFCQACYEDWASWRAKADAEKESRT